MGACHVILPWSIGFQCLESCCDCEMIEMCKSKSQVADLQHPRGRNVRRCFSPHRLHISFSGTPPLDNMERSDMLSNGWSVRCSSCFSFNISTDTFVTRFNYFSIKHTAVKILKFTTNFSISDSIRMKNHSIAPAKVNDNYLQTKLLILFIFFKGKVNIF